MQSDEELMQAYADDDAEAFEILYRRHRGRLLGYLIAKLQNRSEAEEVFQTVFVKLHQARGNYRQTIPFLPWIFTIARNALIDHLRKEQRQQARIILSPEAVDACAAPEPETGPIAAALGELASLTAAQRQALELRFNEGLSFKEIAQQLQLTPDNSRQIVSRAIARLRKLLLGKEARHEKA